MINSPELFTVYGIYTRDKTKLIAVFRNPRDAENYKEYLVTIGFDVSELHEIQDEKTKWLVL